MSDPVPPQPSSAPASDAKAGLASDKPLDVYRVFVDQINKEDNLIHQRMTWGLTVNGGLIAILGVFYQTYKNGAPTEGAALFFFAIVLTGILVSVQTIYATGAAGRQLERIKKLYVEQWHDVFAALELPTPFGHTQTSEQGAPRVDPGEWGWPQYIFVVSIGLWLIIGITGQQYMRAKPAAGGTWAVEVRLRRE